MFKELFEKSTDALSQLLIKAQSFLEGALPASAVETIAQQDNLPTIAIGALIAMFIAFKLLKTIGLIIVLFVVIATSAGFVMT